MAGGNKSNSPKQKKRKIQQQQQVARDKRRPVPAQRDRRN